MPRDLSQFQFMTRDTEPIELRVGERVHVDLFDQDKIEGRVTSWDQHRLSVRTTPSRVARPRWVDITRVVCLDRPRD